GISALLRRRAAAYLALNRSPEADSDFDRAFRLLEEARSTGTARFVRVEQAGLHWKYGHSEKAEQILAGLEADLHGGMKDPHLLSDLLALRARMSRAAGHLDQAYDYARRSRVAALKAVAPLSYFRASVEMAETLQDQGNL